MNGAQNKMYNPDETLQPALLLECATSNSAPYALILHALTHWHTKESNSSQNQIRMPMECQYGVISTSGNWLINLRMCAARSTDCSQISSYIWYTYIYYKQLPNSQPYLQCSIVSQLLFWWLETILRCCIFTELSGEIKTGLFTKQAHLPNQ